VRLAGEAALRVGAGLVTVAAHADEVGAIRAHRPELMVHAVGGAADLVALLKRATVVAVGPGLGQDAWAQSLFDTMLGSDRPCVVDADALNLLARVQQRGDWILTPHPGEAGRLLGCDTAQVQLDRLGSVRQLVERYGGVAVLKGANTLIATAGAQPALCDRGNPGMATAGMGDVLTGAIAGLRAQLHDPWVAARVGVYAHALAGDVAAQAGERGLLAGDVLAQLRGCVNPCMAGHADPTMLIRSC
jgi:ADP-dependent NAD(P)H-hydrate dehydratase / NAD(P)H-hydrate epimerase